MIACQHCGQPRESIKPMVIKLLQGGKGASAIARMLGCSRQYVIQIRSELARGAAERRQLKLFRVLH